MLKINIWLLIYLVVKVFNALAIKNILDEGIDNVKVY